MGANLSGGQVIRRRAEARCAAGATNGIKHFTIQKSGRRPDFLYTTEMCKRRAEAFAELEAAQERISANEAKRAEQKKYFDELKAIAEAEAQERIKKYNDFIKELEQENKKKRKKLRKTKKSTAC